MAKNIIAFQAYTEFFTHVADICFYLQSDVWRENTEATIEKLSKTSIESLDTISRSMQQQKEVLTAQEESLKNQHDILRNEKLLNEALVSSAESAKDVFLEVRDHAKEQKAVFSETFKHIFDSVEKLSNLQKMLLGEFIGLQSFAFYFIASIVSYLFTSTLRASGARLPIFISLSILIISERVSVGWRINGGQELTTEDIHKRIWLLRKLFLFAATLIMGFFIISYKDFNRINYTILQDIQNQICELRKLQEHKSISASDEVDEKTLIATTDKIENVTKQLEMSLQAYITSTPQKVSKICGVYDDTDPFELPTLKLHKPPEERGKSVDMKKSKQSNNEIKAKKGRRKLENEMTTDITSEYTLNESRYNLRSSRRSFDSINTSANQSLLPVNKSKTSNRRKSNSKVTKQKSKEKNCKPAFFSSDDEY